MNKCDITSQTWLLFATKNLKVPKTSSSSWFELPDFLSATVGNIIVGLAFWDEPWRFTTDVFQSSR